MKKPYWSTAFIVLFLCVGIFEIVNAITRRSAGDSDTARQWVTSQYVWAGKNPYAIALAALEAKYGRLAPIGTVHLKETRIYAIPKTGPNPATDPLLGPPEATYPPTTAAVLAGTMGRLSLKWALAVCLGLNFLCVILVARELWLLSGRSSPIRLLLIVSICLVWPATAECFERDQFSLVILWALLMGFRVQGEQPVLSALLYCIALLKPSIGLPFLLLPLTDRRWGILGFVAIAQAGLLALSAWMLHAMPWLLLSQWIAVASYFRQGMYTLQDFINAAHLDGTFLDLLLPLAILAAALLVVGRLSKTTAIAFVSFVAAFWMYHNGYDFVVLLAALPSLLESTVASRILVAFAMAIIGIALLPAVSSSEASGARIFRLTARFCVIAALVISPSLSSKDRNAHET